MKNTIKMKINKMQIIQCLAKSSLMIRFKALLILKQVKVLTGNH